jgi:hypothetical protein
LAVERHLREFDRLGEDLKVIERDLARSALADDAVKLLMTTGAAATSVPSISRLMAFITPVSSLTNSCPEKPGAAQCHATTCEKSAGETTTGLYLIIYHIGFATKPVRPPHHPSSGRCTNRSGSSN